MTREELKEHCIKQIEQCETWAIHRGEEPSGKVYEEHKAILDILEQEPCDAISRADALKVASEECQEFRGIYGRIEDGIQKLPPVTPSRQWIPVSEKLPSDCNEDWVLAQIQEDNGYLWIPCVAEYRKSKDDWYTDVYDVGWIKNHNGVFKVVAWMPLPKPYDAEMESEK